MHTTRQRAPCNRYDNRQMCTAVAAVCLLLLLLPLLLLRLRTFAQQRECAGWRAIYERKTKTMWGFPCHLLGSARRKAIPSFKEPIQRTSMTRAPPRRLVGIQTCVVMYPRPPCLPRSPKCEKEPSAAGEQHVLKNVHFIHDIVHINMQYIQRNVSRRP